MISTREAIYTALFTKLQAISGIATCTRRLKAVSALSGAQMPAIYLHEDAERLLPFYEEFRRRVRDQVIPHTVKSDTHPKR